MIYKRIFLAMTVFIAFSFTSVAADEMPKSDVKPESTESARINLLEERLDGMTKTMQNLTDEVMKWRIQDKCQTIGCNCRFVKECTAVSCRKYDDKGKCVEQVCVAWETKFVCD